MQIRPINNLSIYLERLTKGRLWVKVIIGIALGAGLGMALNPETEWVREDISVAMRPWLELPGQIFLKLVQMIMIPLIITSVMSGIVSNSMETLKSMGVRLLTYFIFTTFVAISIGVGVSVIMKPGDSMHELGQMKDQHETLDVPIDSELGSESLPDIIVNLIPDNPLEAMLTGEMLGIVIFTIIIGVAITQVPNRTAMPIIHFGEAVQKICMIVIGWGMMLVPYAVFGLMAALLSRIGIEILWGLSYYILTVIVGLLVLLVFYLILLGGLTGMKPFYFLKRVREPQLLAFSTASSAAVMPVTMKTADEQLKVSSNISDFVIPIGASINMDGTALFQCVTALFLAQAYGVEMGVIQLSLFTLTIVGASIGTPAIPGGGAIIMASVLQSAGIPAEGLIVIIGIDRILGMFRTTINVTGDLVACVVFNKWFGKPKEVLTPVQSE